MLVVEPLDSVVFVQKVLVCSLVLFTFYFSKLCLSWWEPIEISAQFFQSLIELLWIIPEVAKVKGEPEFRAASLCKSCSSCLFGHTPTFWMLWWWTLSLSFKVWGFLLEFWQLCLTEACFQWWSLKKANTLSCFFQVLSPLQILFTCGCFLLSSEKFYNVCWIYSCYFWEVFFFFFFYELLWHYWKWNLLRLSFKSSSFCRSPLLFCIPVLLSPLLLLCQLSSLFSSFPLSGFCWFHPWSVSVPLSSRLPVNR